MQLSAAHLEGRQTQEDHDRLMERYSRILQESAAKEVSSRSRLDEERKAREAAEGKERANLGLELDLHVEGNAREAEEKVRRRVDEARQRHRVCVI